MRKVASLPRSFRLPGPHGPVLVPARPALEATLDKLHRRHEALNQVIDWLELYQRLDQPRKSPSSAAPSTPGAMSR